MSHIFSFSLGGGSSPATYPPVVLPLPKYVFSQQWKHMHFPYTEQVPI